MEVDLCIHKDWVLEGLQKPRYQLPASQAITLLLQSGSQVGLEGVSYRGVGQVLWHVHQGTSGQAKMGWFLARWHLQRRWCMASGVSPASSNSAALGTRWGCRSDCR